MPFLLAGAIAPEDVTDVRRVVERIYRRLVDDDDDLSRVALATHELLENAAKFSTDGQASLAIEVGQRGEVHVSTRNRATREHVEALTARSRELAAAADPMAYYLQCMKEVSTGGLGLGRIAAEGEMTIELAIDGDEVEVHARSTAK